MSGTGDDPQAAILAALGRPESYPHPAPDLRHVQTHLSHVFLAGPWVYKVKKAVAFAFVDFRSLAARAHFCREEVRLNARLARPVYDRVVALAVGPDGRLEMDGTREPIEWAVRMRRLPADRTLGALVARGAAAAALLDDVAAVIARFHARAERVAGGDPAALVAAWDENLDGVVPFVGRHLTDEALAILRDFGRTWPVRHATVIAARASAGRVRDGHGDLRLDHVYVLDRGLPAEDGAPAIAPGIYVVDCLEFSPALRAVDVAADVAFLAMELAGAERADLARRFVDAYARTADDPLVPALVPYHASHRAVVRGKVEALAADEPEVPADARARAAREARAKLALAGRFAWAAGDPVVVAMAGLAGAGKSAVAEAIAAATGFPVVASDRVRKADPAAPVRYDVAARAAVYAALRRAVDASLGARESLVVDATFIESTERERLARTVRGWGARLVFVHCVADEAVVRARLAAREAGSPSDARWDVYVRQREAADPFGDDEPVLEIETSAGPVPPPGLLPRLWDWRQGRVLKPSARG